MKNDIIRAALISTLNKFFPMLVILHVVNFTDTEQAIVMSFITDFITLLFLFFKTGQQDSGSTSTVTASVTTSPDK